MVAGDKITVIAVWQISVGCSLTLWENDVCPKPARKTLMGIGNQTISQWCQQTRVRFICNALSGTLVLCIKGNCQCKKLS